NRESGLRPRWLPVSRAREGGSRWRSQRWIGVLMADPKDEAVPSTEGTAASTNVPAADVPPAAAPAAPAEPQQPPRSGRGGGRGSGRGGGGGGRGRGRGDRREGD